MKRLLTRIGLGAVALTLAMAPTAAAQVAVPVPNIPIPPLPAQADPVLEVLGPIATPQCATATVVGVLAPALVGPSLPTLPVSINTFALFAPVYTICGELPPAGERVRFVCAVDDQVAALASLAGEQSIGTALPLDLRLVGPAVEVVSVIQDKLPQQAADAGLAKLAQDALACRVFGATAPEAPLPTDDDGDDEAAFDIPVAANSGAPLELSEFLDVLDQANVDTPDLSTVTPARNAERFFTGGPFEYPIVFVLPLLLLAVGAYVGRTLTKPIH